MFTLPLKRLRKSIWMSDTPDIIHVPAIGDEPACYVSTDDATLDEVAFAEVAISRHVTALSRTATALSEIVKLARMQGARGYDNAVEAAVRELEARK